MHVPLRPLAVAQGLEAYVAHEYATVCVVAGSIENDGKLYGNVDMSLQKVLAHVVPGAPIVVPNTREWMAKLQDASTDDSACEIITADGVEKVKVDGRVTHYRVPQAVMREHTCD
jgi:hypothetical protein